MASEREIQIASILGDLQIPFKMEQTYSGLSNTEGALLPVDFSIIVNNRLAFIEYNGPHHYTSGKSVKEKSAHRRFVANGSKRLNWSQKQGIPLLIIHYKDKDRLLDIVNQYVQDVGNLDIKTTQQYSNSTYEKVISEGAQDFEYLKLEPTKTGYALLPMTEINAMFSEMNRLNAEIESYKQQYEELFTDFKGQLQLNEELHSKIAEIQEQLYLQNKSLASPKDVLTVNISGNRVIELPGLPDSIRIGGRYSASFKSYIKNMYDQYELEVKEIKIILEELGQCVALPTIKKFVDPIKTK